MKETDDKRNYTTMELLPEAQCIYFILKGDKVVRTLKKMYEPLVWEPKLKEKIRKK